MQLAEVLPIAEQLLELLSPACLEIQVAGSVRRQRAEVHDLEFVLIPHRDEDLFGNPTEGTVLLDKTLAGMGADNILEWDEDVKRNGPRMKRLKIKKSGLIVELYIADMENFGNRLTIRTGHADFTRWMVTERSKGGAMPPGRRQQGGYLWDTSTLSNHKIIPCRHEIDFFQAIGFLKSMPEPQQRTEQLAQRLWQGRVA